MSERRGTVSARSLAYTAMFAAGAFIKIPFVPAPFTLQTFFCMLAGACLGAEGGACGGCILSLGVDRPSRIYRGAAFSTSRTSPSAICSGCSPPRLSAG